MPVHFEVREDGHIIYARMVDPWTMADYQANVSTDLAHRNAVPFRVHSLINASQTRHMPNGFLSVRSSPSFTHPRAGLTAVVGTGMMIRIFGETLMRLANVAPPKFFEEEAEAWDYLRQVIRDESPDTAPTNG